MNFNDLVDALINSQDNANLQMYVNDSALAHRQNEQDCLAYLQGEFKDKMTAFKRPS